MIERYHDRDYVQDCTARAARAKLCEFATHRMDASSLAPGFECSPHARTGRTKNILSPTDS